jgi:hypothetical protein
VSIQLYSYPPANSIRLASYFLSLLFLEVRLLLNRICSLHQLKTDLLTTRGTGRKHLPVEQNSLVRSAMFHVADPVNARTGYYLARLKLPLRHPRIAFMRRHVATFYPTRCSAILRDKCGN